MLSPEYCGQALAVVGLCPVQDQITQQLIGLLVGEARKRPVLELRTPGAEQIYLKHRERRSGTGRTYFFHGRRVLQRREVARISPEVYGADDAPHDLGIAGARQIPHEDDSL